jgi:hypothetical protein
VERAAAILRDELSLGALDNIARADRIWSAQEIDVFGVGTRRRLRQDIETFLDTMLDLLAPRSDALSVLRSPYPVAPGRAAEIQTRLANETHRPVELSFACGDLTSASESRIDGDRVHISPTPLHIPAGKVADMAIRLEIPRDARPGVYKALLQASDASVRAMLTFSVA